MEKNIYDELAPGATEEQRKEFGRVIGRMVSGVNPLELRTKLSDGVVNDCQDLKPSPIVLLFRAAEYKTEMISAENGIYLEHIVPTGGWGGMTKAYSLKAMYEILKTKSVDDVLRWINRYGFFYTQISTCQNHNATTLTGSGLLPGESYPLKLMVDRVNRLKDIWALIDQLAAGGGPLLGTVRSVPAEDIELDAIGWHGIRPVKTIVTSSGGYYLTVDGKPLAGTWHDSPPVSWSDRSRLLIEGLSTLIMELTQDSKYETTVTVPTREGSLLPWTVKTETYCQSPECYYLLWVLRFLSNGEQRRCDKCGVLFIPAGERPGKQKYCPACSHGSQNKYKERQRAAVRAFRKEGLSLEAAAERYGVKLERLEVVLSGEKSI